MKTISDRVRKAVDPMFLFVLGIAGMTTGYYSVAYRGIAESREHHALVAGFPIWEILSNPVTINALVGLGVFLYNRIAKANEKTDRWLRVTTLAFEIADDVRGALRDPSRWREALPAILKTIVEEVAHNPGIKSLTEKEVELLKPLVTAYVRRKAGLLDGPDIK